MVLTGGAQIVVRGANVYPADERYEHATAVAIARGRIAYVGTDAGVREFIGTDTRVIEAGGRALLPGLVDAHQHLLYGARVGDYHIRLAPDMDEAECLAAIRRHVARHPNEKVYPCVGFAPELFGEFGPRREALDAICDFAPVVALSYDGHTTWVNSRALSEAGIGKGTPEPEKGVVCRDESGVPTGYLLGGAGACAGGLMSRFMPAYTKEQNKLSILRAQEEMFRLGVTTVYDAHVEPDENYFMAYEELARAGEWKLRARGAWFIPRELGGEADVCARIDRCAGYKDIFQTDRFRVNGFKFLLDMTVEAGTARLIEPYLGRDDGWRGVKIWEDGALLARLFAKIDRMGYQIHLHQMGDGAARDALDALEQAGELRMRHTFAHCQLIADEDKRRMARLGVSALAAPYWINAAVLSSIDIPTLGTARAMRQYPVKSLLDAGVVVASHSDYTVSEPSVCGALYGFTKRTLAPCAFRRFFRDGTAYTTDPAHPPAPGILRPLPPEGERIGVEDAVRLMTYNGVYSMCEEGETGSVTPGKAADLVLLSADIRDLCESGRCVEADMTVCAGEIVFERKMINKAPSVDGGR